MSRFLLFLSLALTSLCVFLSVPTAMAQDSPRDTLPVVKIGSDSLSVKRSVPKKPFAPKKADSINRIGNLPLKNPVDSTASASLAGGQDSVFIPFDYKSTKYALVLKDNSFFNFFGKGVLRTSEPRTAQGKEGIFYLLSGLFFLMAVVKTGFGRYFQNLFTVFFRATLKQKQIREQLQQTQLASLLLNLLFVGVGGLYACIILYGHLQHEISFWLLYGYCVGALVLIYTCKYFILKLLGLTLRLEPMTDNYIFIVFLCNKVLAVFLLPLLLVVAFAYPKMVTVTMTISYVLVIGIFLYRYITSYGYISREVRASRFHFFLYLCAFEVAPLLLIYKVLLKYV